MPKHRSAPQLTRITLYLGQFGLAVAARQSVGSVPAAGRVHHAAVLVPAPPERRGRLASLPHHHGHQRAARRLQPQQPPQTLPVSTAVLAGRPLATR